MKENRKINNYHFDPWSPTALVDDVPIPSEEMLRYAKEQETLTFKNLALHVVTTMVLADALISTIQKANADKSSDEQFDINRDVALETMIAVHATRPLAELGKVNQAEPAINEYMQTHDDVELAVLEGMRNHLPLSIIQSMELLEKSRGFPEQTLGPDLLDQPETVNWTTTITQMASWQVAGSIQPIDQRYDDLIARHANNPNSPKHFSRDELLAIKAWGKERMGDISKHIGINSDEFFSWQRELIIGTSAESRAKSDDLIRELFHREPNADEFVPISPAYQYLARSIMNIDSENINDSQKKDVELLLAKPGLFLRICRSYGVLKTSDNHQYSSNI